jgi:formylglycine-generating enzyme required for sulfatase activity
MTTILGQGSGKVLSQMKSIKNLALGSAVLVSCFFPLWGCQENPKPLTTESNPPKPVPISAVAAPALCDPPSRPLALAANLSSETKSTSGSEPKPTKATEGMSWIAPGKFWMGVEDPTMPDARPVREIELSGYWIDQTEVTNRQYEAFVKATGYKTVAEIPPKAEDYPGADPKLLVPGSVVFTPPAAEIPLDDFLQWWRWQPGADWRHPEGPESSIADRMDHPVVQIAYEDATAYAKWAGKRLPTEAEWERASRGGLERKKYVWGDELNPNGKWMSNNWQGGFPNANSKADGFYSTAPVKSYAPNGFGIYDMSANVWEWCSDWYRPDAYKSFSAKDPKGPSDSFDPLEPGIPKRVHRGGSFLCSDFYCIRYLPAARGKGAIDSGANHLGFRCVKDAG